MASESEESLVAKLQAENAALRNELDFMKNKFREVELEEEHITNQLLKRLEEKKREKELLLQQVEQEEEYLTNTLQQKLLQVRKEKVEMENQLEQEEEFLTNKLQKMLDEIVEEKKELEKKLEESESAREKLKKEVEELREKTGAAQSELNNTRSSNQRYRIQLKKLKADNFVLSQKANSNQEKLEEIKKEKFLLEADMELKNENEFNAVARKKRGRSVSCHVSTQQPALLSSSVPKTKPIQIARPPTSMDAEDDDIFPSGSFGSVGSFGSFGSFGKTNPLAIPSKDKSFSKAPPAAAMSASPANSFLSNSYMESFLHSRTPVVDQPGSSRTCVKRGWLKTLQSDDSWSLSMFVVYDNGDLLCCSSESGVTVKINLDTVLAIIDRSKFVYDIGKSYPPHTFEMKTKFCSYFVSCETEKEYQEWTQLLEELSPLC